MDPIKLNKEYSIEPFDLQKMVENVDINLKDLFEIVYEAEVKNNGIAEALGMPNFMEFYEEVQKLPIKKDKGPRLHYILLSWNESYEIARKNGKLEQIIDKAFIYPQMDVVAVGDPSPELNRTPNENEKMENYSIEFEPLNELADLPIKVDPMIEYKKMRVLVYPSLYQIINSIFWELTFVGYTPEERNDALDKILERKGDLEDALNKEIGSEIIKDALKDMEKEKPKS